jgi:hypothetical protein
MWDLLYIGMIVFLIVEVVREKLGASGINQREYYPIN